MLLRRKQVPKEITDDLFYQFSPDNDESPQQREGEFLGTFLSNQKLLYFFIFLAFCLILILGRAFYLQIIKGDYYQKISDNNRSRVEYIHATRGLIYDSKGVPLVSNQPRFTLSITPGDLPYGVEARQNRLDEIADQLGIERQALTQIINDYPPNLKQPVTLKEDLEYQDALALAIKIEGLQEVALESSSRRKYLDSNPFSHIFGYLGKINRSEYDQSVPGDYLLTDYIGKNGLELSYEKQLRGELGLREIEVDAQGHEKKVLFQKESVRGENIVLTIDKQLQDAVFQMTKEHLRQLGKNKASVIIEQPQTGAILAMVSYPSVDNNLFIQGFTQEEYAKLIADPHQPLFDRSIKGEYPSGSTIKMIVGAGALEENIINDSTSFLSTGGIWVLNKWYFPDWRAGGHGITNIYKALADSVNTFFYIIGGGYQDFNGLGVDRMGKYFKLFGLGAQTGIDLPGEKSGLVPDPDWKDKIKKELWYIGDTYHMAIGQGDVLVTPLQVANYTSVFANGGNLVKPHLVSATVDEKNIQTKIEPVIIRSKLIDDYNLLVIRKGLRRGVTDGSARALQSVPVPVAGKTGTAELGGDKTPHAWFTGFAPYDKPEIVVTVLIEEGGEGSGVAVPLANKIMTYYFGEYKKGN